MGAMDLVFKNGHFYDKKTCKRILFKEGCEFHVVLNEDSYQDAPAAGRHIKNALSRDEIKNKLEQKGDIDYHRILEKGSFLFFTVKNKYDFKAELMEDLYLYKKKGKSAEEYVLFDCYCKTIAHTSGNIDYFEEVSGKSLNDLFKCTYIHYIGNRGNPAANALISFFTDEEKRNPVDNLRKKNTGIT